MRVSIGHGLLRIGLFIRKVSTGLAALCTVAILVVIVSAMFGSNEFPTVFGESGERVNAWTYVRQAALLIVALIVGGRVILAGLFAAAGWHMLPRDHRDLLTDLNNRMMGA